MKPCKTDTCNKRVRNNSVSPYCSHCQAVEAKILLANTRKKLAEETKAAAKPVNTPSIMEQYPQYYKDVREIDYIDVYGVCDLFEVDDRSGALHHSVKKILLSGVRTGLKSQFNDIKEARDTLNRWLEMHK